ncbi:MAG: tetratricopeptide repeat protein [Alphaproteobacteria bacterium]|nr:tetratricopeptide repeat protein [Alphaproteobacteria bacterium]MBL6937534.1 tetratricopeptide repeat protein [Alphaproteobacteria bacterium]MBL7098872.1 tetratricopeptide repeat protein [Alphaproteobacteria bacterium]
MNRSIARIAGLALCATALSACGSIGLGGDDSRVVSAPPAASGGPLVAPGADLTAMITQAQTLRQNGDLTGALHILSQLMLAEPDDPRVVGEYGKLLVQQNRPADAVAFLNRAIQLSPNDWSLYSALGVANDQGSNPTGARVAYEHALQLKPNEPAVLNNYAMSRMLAGDRAEARALLARAQAAGGNDPKILQNIALLDSTNPAASATPAPAAASTPAPVNHSGLPAAPAKPVHNTGVASNALPPPPAAPASTHAPAPLVAPAKPGTQVVMQAVPVDPLSGPINNHHGKPAKPARLAKAPKKADDHKVAHDAPAKPDKKVAAAAPPAKPAKPAKAGPPALRMTADAGKP